MAKNSKKTLDFQYMGTEPKWDEQPAENLRQSTLTWAFNWYNYFKNQKDAKAQIVKYLASNNKKAESKLVAKLPDSVIKTTYAWLMIMAERGLELTKQEQKHIDAELDRLVELATPTGTANETEEAEEKSGAKKPNVQEIMREKALEVGGDLEGLLDEYVSNSIPTKHKLSPITILKTSTMLPQHVPMLIEAWEVKLAEFTEAYQGKDADLQEGYGHFSKIQLRNLVKFSEQVISDLNSYVNFKKASRAKPTRKPITPEKQVAKLKYLKEFKELGLKSIAPTKLIDCKEVFVYDVSKRKLRRYIADEHSTGITVKGSALVGFDVMKSTAKTIRKPKEQVKKLAGASRPASRKMFSEIKSVETKVTGRLNENIVILRVH